MPSKYYLLHRERCIAAAKAWQATHPEAVKAANQRHYAKHRGKVQAKTMNYRARRMSVFGAAYAAVGA